MLNKEKHDAIMKNVLVDIYSDNLLAANLVFKGGTACYLFYNLPRFSVDLDFNLIDVNLTEEVFEKIKKIAAKYGKVERPYIKRHTIFAMIAYAKGFQKIKIEISIRSHDKDSEEIKNFMGVSFLVMKRRAMAANKLVALSERNRLANRDVFDVHWFLSNVNEWDVDEDIIKNKTGKSLVEYFEYLTDFVEKKVPETNILQGLGELISAKQKDWVKSHLKKDLIFQLRNYADSMRRSEEVAKI
jgi:predicted nucleotidyltransferase component of viral defense system